MKVSALLKIDFHEGFNKRVIVFTGYGKFWFAEEPTFAPRTVIPV